MPKKPFFQGRHILRRNEDGSVVRCESSYSLSKQEFLQGFVRNHATAMASGETYLFVDCHGGLGNWRDSATNQYCNGSPVIFYRTLEDMDLPYRGLVFELDEDRYEQLRSNLYFQRDNVTVYNSSNCNAPEYLRRIAYDIRHNETSVIEEPGLNEHLVHDSDPYMYGLIYYDYTGWPHISEMQCVAESSSMDLLIHFSTSWWKAKTPEQKREMLDCCIWDRLDELERRYWYVTDPSRGVNNRFNFTFLYGTNVHNTSMHPDLVPLQSEEGARRLIKAQYAKRLIDKDTGMLIQNEEHVI